MATVVLATTILIRLRIGSRDVNQDASVQFLQLEYRYPEMHAL